MYVQYDNKHLYLSSWEYNCARILSYLATIAEDHNATVKYGRPATITNRTLTDACRDISTRIDKLNAVNTERAHQAAITFETERARLASINNTPIQVTHLTYISFKLDNVYYSYSADNNPFFPFHYCKTSINNNSIDLDAFYMEAGKDWLYDCFFTFNASDSDCKDAANIIFNELMHSNFSTIRREHTKRRVTNLYNSGYHYEYIETPKRVKRLDF